MLGSKRYHISEPLFFFSGPVRLGPTLERALRGNCHSFPTSASLNLDPIPQFLSLTLYEYMYMCVCCEIHNLRKFGLSIFDFLCFKNLDGRGSGQQGGLQRMPLHYDENMALFRLRRNTWRQCGGSTSMWHLLLPNPHWLSVRLCALEPGTDWSGQGFW